MRLNHKKKKEANKKITPKRENPSIPHQDNYLDPNTLGYLAV